MDLIDSKNVVTRKPHSCWGCGEKFAKGSKLTRTTSADGGSVQSVYWCAICDEWWASFGYMDDDGIEFGSLVGDDEWKKLKKELTKPRPAPADKGGKV